MDWDPCLWLSKWPIFPQALSLRIPCRGMHLSPYPLKLSKSCSNSFGANSHNFPPIRQWAQHIPLCKFVHMAPRLSYASHSKRGNYSRSASIMTGRVMRVLFWSPLKKSLYNKSLCHPHMQGEGMWHSSWRLEWNALIQIKMAGCECKWITAACLRVCSRGKLVACALHDDCFRAIRPKSGRFTIAIISVH